ncbi:MAG: hypothetical protein JWO18_1769 [Microbacteriaceae bacterium]|nr:hypothetical protein [Microbacteriaceae bacterium]
MFEGDVTVPAGWYPDPMGLPQLRWWNNHAWTELTTEARPPLVMQQSTRLAYADEELPTRRQQREQRERDEQYVRLATDEHDADSAQSPLSAELKELDPPSPLTVDVEEPAPFAGDAATTTEPATIVEALLVDPIETAEVDEMAADQGEEVASVYAPRSAATAVSASSGPPKAKPRPDAVPAIRRTLGRLPLYTAAVWIIALVPLLLLVASLLLLLGFGASLGITITAEVWGSSYLLVVILAIVDGALLKRAGYEHRASWAWALLTAPVYLIARSASISRIGRLGLAPLLVWAVLGLLQIGSVLVVPGLLISAIPTVFSMEAQQSVASDASIIGAQLDVTCPPIPPVIIGQQFGCAAKSSSGDSYEVTVSLQRVNGWIDWRVDDWGLYTLQR